MVPYTVYNGCSAANEQIYPPPSTPPPKKQLCLSCTDILRMSFKNIFNIRNGNLKSGTTM